MGAILSFIFLFLAARALWITGWRALTTEPPRQAKDVKFIKLSEINLPILDGFYNDKFDLMRVKTSSQPVLKYWWNEALTEEERSKTSNKLRKAIERRINEKKWLGEFERRDVELIAQGKIGY